MEGKLTLYVCHIDEGGPRPHACRRVPDALRSSGHEFEKVIFAKGIPFGLFTKGRRPELKAMSGQEKLPVLKLQDGSTISGSANIIAWANSNESSRAATSADGGSPGVIGQDRR
jgi:glutathione S-transferase